MQRAIVFSFFFVIIAVPALSQSDSVFTGVASYYAKKFNGRKTANGEIFSSDSLTAAHKKLPFGTTVRVTNLKNDSSVVVRINDRLPANSRRAIDLSRAAAKKLNFIREGLAKVRIEILPSETGGAGLPVPEKNEIPSDTVNQGSSGGN